MPTVTTTQQWKLAELGFNQVQAGIRMGVFLAAIGDILIVESSFIEQLDSVSSIGQNVANVTAARTYTIEFRHSVDNSTWTSWASWTIGSAQAITYDANATNYFQHRITRTGSDATGMLEVQSILLGFLRDPSATAGHGSFTDVGMLWELRQFLKAVIQSRVVQYASRDRFTVLTFEERQTSAATNNVVLIAGLTVTEFANRYTESDDWPIRCDLLVKMEGGTNGNNLPVNGGSDFYEMCGILLTMFREGQNSQYRYSFTFKGVSFVNVALGDLSASAFKIRQIGPVLDSKTDSVYEKFELNFTIFAKKKHLG